MNIQDNEEPVIIKEYSRKYKKSVVSKEYWGKGKKNVSNVKGIMRKVN